MESGGILSDAEICQLRARLREIPLPPGGGSGGGEDEAIAAARQAVGEALSAELLLEPMRRLVDAFTEWMETAGRVLPRDERRRREDQLAVYRDIMAVCTAADGTEADSHAVVSQLQSLMARLQVVGEPPDQVLLAAGFEEDDDAPPPAAAGSSGSRPAAKPEGSATAAIASGAARPAAAAAADLEDRLDAAAARREGGDTAV